MYSIAQIKRIADIDMHLWKERTAAEKLIAASV
jgi:hypothetical protein